MKPQFLLCAGLDVTVLGQKDFRVCGLGLWSFLISIKIQGQFLLHSIFLLLLSLVDLGIEVGFKCPYVIIFTWKLNALFYHPLSLGPDRGSSKSDNHRI